MGVSLLIFTSLGDGPNILAHWPLCSCLEGYVPGSKNIGMKVRHLHVFDQYYQMVIGEGNGNPLQYFCQGNPMDGGGLWATVHGITRVRHNLAIKSPPPPNGYIKFTITDNRELKYINIKAKMWKKPTSPQSLLKITTTCFP